jgi:hypothetical protein
LRTDSSDRFGVLFDGLHHNIIREETEMSRSHKACFYVIQFSLRIKRGQTQHPTPSQSFQRRGPLVKASLVPFPVSARAEPPARKRVTIKVENRPKHTRIYLVRAASKGRFSCGMGIHGSDGFVVLRAARWLEPSSSSRTIPSNISRVPVLASFSRCFAPVHSLPGTRDAPMQELKSNKLLGLVAEILTTRSSAHGRAIL